MQITLPRLKGEVWKCQHNGISNLLIFVSACIWRSNYTLHLCVNPRHLQTSPDLLSFFWLSSKYANSAWSFWWCRTRRQQDSWEASRLHKQWITAKKTLKSSERGLKNLHFIPENIATRNNNFRIMLAWKSHTGILLKINNNNNNNNYYYYYYETKITECISS